ncbi:N-glycosylase/DNA lyase, partial [Charadrius vociferus]
WESSPGAWTGVLGERVWTLRQERDRLWYTVYGEGEDGPPPEASKPDGAETDQILRDYFQLDVGLPALYRAWGAADPLFRKVANDFPGVRVLRQDPVECLLSFICTSNNHISRITAMIERLCQAFGRRLCCLDARPVHAFPSLVADCVCLMALDKAEAVPVDTHVWRIARQRYGAALSGRSLTPRAHQEIGDFFRGLWGPRAGWAQAVLFCADLRK